MLHLIDSCLLEYTFFKPAVYTLYNTIPAHTHFYTLFYTHFIRPSGNGGKFTWTGCESLTNSYLSLRSEKERKEKREGRKKGSKDGKPEEERNEEKRKKQRKKRRKGRRNFLPFSRFTSLKKVFFELL